MKFPALPGISRIAPYPSYPLRTALFLLLAALWLTANAAALFFSGTANLLLLNIIIMAFQAVAVAIFDRKTFSSPGGMCWNKGDVKCYLAGCGIFLFADLLLEAIKLLLKMFDISFTAEQTLLKIMQSGTLNEKLLAAVLCCIAAPVCEELVFRRVCFGFFLRAGQLPAMLLTAALFAAVHFFPAGTLPLFLLGFALQYIYLHSGKISVAAAVHATGNIFAVMTVIWQNYCSNA